MTRRSPTLRTELCAEGAGEKLWGISDGRVHSCSDDNLAKAQSWSLPDRSLRREMSSHVDQSTTFERCALAGTEGHEQDGEPASSGP